MSAVVLGYGHEPMLGDCVQALLGSSGVDCDVVVVDNGETSGALDRLRCLEGVTVVGDGTNLGFSAGCNLGAEHARGEYLALVNGDAVVAPDALDQLVAVAARPSVGVAAGSIRLHDRPDLLNSGGNTLHFLGFSWCDHLGEAAAAFPAEMPVATAMGSAIVLRTDVWRSVGGFDPHYFAYHEDVDLCIGLRLRGYDIVWVRDAVVSHRYEFSRVPAKLGLSERNRLAFVLTTFQTRTLVLLAPAFLAMELGGLVLALAQGWGGQKLGGWWWLWRHRQWLGERRRALQAARRRPDRVLVPFITTSLGFQPFPLPPPATLADTLLRAWWWLVKRWV